MMAWTIWALQLFEHSALLKRICHQKDPPLFTSEIRICSADQSRRKIESCLHDSLRYIRVLLLLPASSLKNILFNDFWIFLSKILQILFVFVLYKIYNLYHSPLVRVGVFWITHFLGRGKNKIPLKINSKSLDRFACLQSNQLTL